MTLSSEDRSEIMQALHLFGFLADGRFEFIDQVFAADAVLEAAAGGGPSFEGRDQIRGLLAKLHSTRITNHVATNEAVVDSASEGSAKTLSKFVIFNEGGFLVTGSYEDDFVRTSEGWRIAYRPIRHSVVARSEASSMDEFRDMARTVSN